jgi:hypothetical protein
MTRLFRRLLLAAALATSIAMGLAAQATRPAEPVVIPFELVTRHILVEARINQSRPLWFVFDTGADRAVIRTDVAHELRLELEGQVGLRGAGPGMQSGSRVKGARWSLPGLQGFSQPVAIAVPLPNISSTMGRAVDGIIGGEFIRQFVVEVDYEKRALTLHNRGAFEYTGPGESVPVDFVENTQPTIEAVVTPLGGQPLRGRFLFDLGSGLPLALHSPFVARHQLLSPDMKTVRVMGAGAGGTVAGRLGRVASLQIGTVSLAHPVTLFSQDRAGSFANPALAGNIGAQVGNRFRLFLDYGRKRIIFEPLSTVHDPYDRAFSGLGLRAFGDDFRTFRVFDVLEDSPATNAGIQKGDVIVAIDGVPADRLTLSALNQMLEKPVKYMLTIRRGETTLTVALTPALLI